jgi:PQQ-like domain
VIVSEGNVFVLPDEGKHLLVYDAGSGREVKRIGLDTLGRWNVQGGMEPADKPNTLIGVAGEKLLLAGDHRVLCMDWKKYDDEKLSNGNDEAIIWPSMFRSIRGRPFLTTTALFVPDEESIRKIDMVTGRTMETYPVHPRTWDEGEGPGNVLVSGDHVVVAGATAVQVYTDLAVATEKLNAEVAAAPTDPEPRLRYAEVMFVAGQPDEAIRRLDEAAKLLGGLENLQPGFNRDRLFNDALTFAQKSLADGRAGAAERVVKLFDRASAAAHSPQQQVQYRLSRARHAAAGKDHAAAVKLYQEVLSADQMRAVSLADSAGNPVLAEDVAEKTIEEVIKAAGPGVYEPYQQAAAKAVDDAQGEGDAVVKAEKLLAIAQQYPNSNVAPRAMLAAAESFEAAKLPRQAVRVLRQMWFKYQSSPSRAQIAEGIARNYLSVNDRNRAEMISTAAARLANAVALPGDPKLSRPLTLPDGTVVAAAGTSMEKALEEVRKLSGREAVKTLPDFRLPPPPTQAEKQAGKKYPKPFLQQGQGVPVPDAVMLVLPARDFTRSDRLITWSPNALSLFKPTEPKPLATSKAFPSTGPLPPGIAGAAPGPNRWPGAPRGVAWTGDTALVWGGSRLVAIDGNNAKTLWEIDLARLAALEVVRAGDVPGGGGAAAPVVVGMDPNVAVIPGQQVIIDGRFGRRVIRGGPVPVNPLQPVNVNPAIAAPAPGHPAPPVPGQGEQVSEVRPVGDRVLIATTTGRLMSADLSGGRVAWQTRLAEKAVDRLVATEDFTVVKTSGDLAHHIFALDTFSGRVLGRLNFPLQMAGQGQVPQVPVNLALSPDGTLVYTMPERLVLKDLYKGWNENDKSIAGDRNQAVFAGASQPGQLLISEGRILAVADNYGVGVLQVQEKYVRVHSLETGQSLTLKYDPNDGTRKQVDRILTAGTKDWNVILRTVGSRLYVIGPQSVFSYNLDRPAETWKGMTHTLSDGPTSDVNYRDAFIGQSHLVVLDQPPVAGNGPQSYRLHAFGRYQKEADASPGESGRLDYSFTVNDPAGIAPQWQACDGGFYYATSDGKVRMLVGAKPK